MISKACLMGRMHEAKIARVVGTLRHVAYLPWDFEDWMGHMHEAKIARVAGTLRHVAYLPWDLED